MAGRHAPAAGRNRGPILSVLREVLPPRGIVLEIASGTGEHVLHFAEHLPELIWQPSEPDADNRESIRAWTATQQFSNLLPPLAIDVHQDDWAIEHVDAMVCINMIHISPWESCIALLQGAAPRMPDGGLLVLYGPYKVGGQHTAPSNDQFDRSLRARNPEWGVRDLRDVEAAALEAGFELVRAVDMPANNLTVVFRRQHLIRPGRT